jgi:5-oxopent-3-ene-1,2,5-tricarboxylate decarboxylase/2-hydroxyhepta-2,4-diene-1,7-dioate isomerase
MKIMRIQSGSEAVWAIAEGDNAYALEGDVYTSPAKGGLIGPIASLKVLSTILPENKVIIILDNWRGKMDRVAPSFIIKNPSARINPGETVIYPKIATRVFFETELGIVIGKKAKNVTLEQAPEHIVGYTISNDMTSFDFTIDVGVDKVVFGKGFDTFSCVGPCITTGLDPTKLTMRGKINGEEFFDTSSGLMNWNAYELVSWVSQVTTLNPGDVISCGAPPGAMTRQTQPGDHVTLIIDEIGTIDLDVVAE